MSSKIRPVDDRAHGVYAVGAQVVVLRCSLRPLRARQSAPLRCPRFRGPHRHPTHTLSLNPYPGTGFNLGACLGDAVAAVLLAGADRRDAGPPVFQRPDHADNVSLVALAVHETVRADGGDLETYRRAMFICRRHEQLESAWAIVGWTSAAWVRRTPW